jgi:hypothetical protein
MTLAKTAADMRRTADQRPGRNCTHKLPRGLRLTIMRNGDRLTLEAARMGVFPSDQEAKIVAAVFRVPAAVRMDKFQSGPKSNPFYENWDGLRWEWDEPIPPALPVLQQATLILPS